MTMVNIHEAKTHLSRLLDRVAAGEEIIIAKAGTPVARLVPLTPLTAPREPGHLKITLPDSFFDPLPDDEIEAWER